MPLQDDLLALAALDRRVVRDFVESNWDDLKDALFEYQAMRREIRIRVVDQTEVLLESEDAAALLQKITTGEGLPTDKVLAHLHSALGPKQALEEFAEEDLEELGSELFYSWFSHYEYIAGLAELRPLIVGGSVGESVSRLVRQVKDCYAFQQYDAAYGMCRAVIEASVRDICVRRQLFPDLGDNVVLFEEFKWSQLRDKVSSGPLRERLRCLYSRLCAVLHARKSVAKDEARRAFEETLQVVEQLYAANGL
jgi:hypothetical protein